jgi:hypothetical protein
MTTTYGRIEVYPRSVYGRTLWYPSNDAAQLLADLMAVKTFTVAQIALMGGSGAFEVVKVMDPALEG